MENAEGKIVSRGASHEKDSSQCIKVAVHIRPLITTELTVGCTDCITVVSGEPQVQIGSHVFTFDHVYGGTGSPSSAIFDECVAPLVDAFLNGYNATVLAYGQTGSGKTYTMGTNYSGEAASGGIIPKVMETIFSRVEAMKETTEFLIRVSFIEIFKEEVFDLLDPSSLSYSKGEGASLVKPAVPARLPIQIRETANGGITLSGVIEAEVRTKEEMGSYLSRGSLSRATGSTNMNSQSSRSHAIFTICMEQKKNTRCTGTPIIDNDASDDILCAKLHLVDLAGSERAKRTGADGLRLKEGIHINKGLLSLGNVISALGDEKKRKEGGHVPYRDSKLTRLLQDSLGGNSKTVMIACVSPADTNAEETLNTLKYANRARNIQNKAIINRDPVAAQMQRMRSQIEQLQSELLYFRGEGGAPFEELQILRHKISLLEASNVELQRELQERQVTCDHLAQRSIDAQVEKDELILKIESARNGKSWDDIDSGDVNKEFGLVKTYVSRMQELEGELMRLQSLSNSNRDNFIDSLDMEDDGLRLKSPYLDVLPSICDDKAIGMSGEMEEVEKELEHSSLQDKLDKELKELDKRLEQKEAEMKRFETVDTSVIKHHYEKKVQELEQEKRALLNEIENLRSNLVNISSASDDGAQKLKEEYLQKLNILETQVSALKKKQDAQAQLLRQKQKSDEAAKRLQEEIQRIKSQKVHLQHKIKQESEQFRSWKASREKEVLQLKKEGRRNEYEMHKLLALNQRQKMVVQRKTEEAAMATKRLKELLETRKASSRETSGAGNGNGSGIQALMQAIEHELEVTVRVHEVRLEYERQKEVRAAMANEVSKLKEQAEVFKRKNSSDSLQTISPGARNSRILALENMLATSSSTLVSMASQLSEAEERERIFSGRGRWNQVRSIADAKNVMNYLFNLASSSRCLLRDKEVDCKEKDAVIRELKEKIVRLTSLVKQMEAHEAELLRQQELQMLASKKNSMESMTNFGLQIPSTTDGHVYDLRKGPRNSSIFSCSRNNNELLEDMDTSESESSEFEAIDDEWVNSAKRPVKRRASRAQAYSLVACNPEHVRVQEKLSSESSIKETNCRTVNTASSICCSCSKRSLCKTPKCECRVVNGTCGESCGCEPTMCSNREADLMNDELGDQSLSERAEDGMSSTGTNEIERTKVLASQGAMLLQNALSDKPVEVNEDHGTQRNQRKALSDIGNSLARPDAPKPNQRKKWRKAVIQLVPEAPLSNLPETTEALSKPEKSTAEPEVPLKLPRSMRSAMVNNNLLRERNFSQSDESIANKEVGMVAPRSPARKARNSEVKENRGN
ncbi:kinesin-like protein KIN-4C isoform X2 [Macadamia integrifolia]|uniref:kinesin-like protein KIN-4C isoform X2 n=1 Tax=Macadamia integrifolia TaxID=60698 RepID=UPI001C4FDCF3|nr:kinesin-like protein KIN-4C isoform X2 [Macadamia integrifolia]